MIDNQPGKFAWQNRIPKLPISGMSKLLLYNLATRAKPDGTPFSSRPYTQQEIADELGLSKRQAIRIIQALVKSGYLSIEKLGRNNIHTIAIDRIKPPGTDANEPPTGDIGVTYPESIGDMGVTYSEPTGDMGVTYPEPIGDMGVTYPEPTGDMGVTYPEPTGDMGVTYPEPTGDMGVTYPEPTGDMGVINASPEYLNTLTDDVVSDDDGRKNTFQTKNLSRQSSSSETFPGDAEQVESDDDDDLKNSKSFKNISSALTPSKFDDIELGRDRESLTDFFRSWQNKEPTALEMKYLLRGNVTYWQQRTAKSPGVTTPDAWMATCLKRTPPTGIEHIYGGHNPKRYTTGQWANIIQH